MCKKIAEELFVPKHTWDARVHTTHNKKTKPQRCIALVRVKSKRVGWRNRDRWQ